MVVLLSGITGTFFRSKFSWPDEARVRVGSIKMYLSDFSGFDIRVCER